MREKTGIMPPGEACPSFSSPPATEMEMLLLTVATANMAATGALCEALVRRGLIDAQDIRRIHQDMSAVIEREDDLVPPHLAATAQIAIDHLLAPVFRKAKEHAASG